MEAQATAKFVRMGPRKVRFVLDTIRGKYVNDADAQLQFTPNYAADEILNVLRSAVANAENNHGMDISSLKVVRCYVDPGPTAKRVQPRAQGRAYRILKRTSHITVVVAEADPKPTMGAKELELKRRGPKPPLRAALPTPAVPAVEATASVEQTAPVEATAPVEETTPVTDAPATTETGA